METSTDSVLAARDFPVEAISAEASREKSVQKGHFLTL